MVIFQILIILLGFLEVDIDIIFPAMFVNLENY